MNFGNLNKYFDNILSHWLEAIELDRIIGNTNGGDYFAMICPSFIYFNPTCHLGRTSRPLLFLIEPTLCQQLRLIILNTFWKYYSIQLIFRYLLDDFNVFKNKSNLKNKDSNFGDFYIVSYVYRCAETEYQLEKSKK